MNSKAEKLADDVLSVLFDPDELLSRVRSQLGNRHLACEIRKRLHFSEEPELTRENHRTAALGRRGDRGCLSADGRVRAFSLLFPKQSR